MAVFVRVALEALLVYLIWRNTHWSVALFAALATLRFEFEDWEAGSGSG